MKKPQDILAKIGLAGVLAGATIGIYAYLQDYINQNNMIIGEIKRDYIKKLEGIEFYCLEIENEIKDAEYKIICVLGSPEELIALDRNFISSEESGSKGDLIEVGLDFYYKAQNTSDIILPSNKVKKTKSQNASSINRGYKLSNGIVIPKEKILRVEDFDEGKMILVGLGRDKNKELRIYDEGDGLPYHFIKARKRVLF